MSTQPAPESAPEAGTTSTPTPVISSPSVGQPPSGQAGQPPIDDALIEKLLAHPKFKPRLDAAVQSVKDKRFAEIERIKMYLDSNNGDVAKARREMLMDEVETQLLGRENTGSVQQAQPNQSDLQSKTADLLRDMNVAPDDPELLAMSQQSYATEFDWLKAVSGLGIRRLRGELPPPRSTNMGVGTSSSPAVPADKGQKIARLTSELQTLMQQPNLNSGLIKSKNEELAALLRG
ncbi:linker histone H1 and H5 family [Caudoviricetes sp.]|nr:linker histone H1 and H5 family [Caudoviricetes sp.]UOF81134.1 linker histone H1 and H5 family [Caudoviricetes sp.]UOF82230.1 linker histone H1 and H5 family [Caudoviricetes sp.]UOF82479.1 linker histone H1 and H5 family [Caudoviricetes sp.]UOF82633.1 linker histone H1 and H5 family [Caudoviricetes sp.]